ncbi:glucose dehydrogenase [FAD, quinone]-like [Zerene cesonia]|uniref:glucose dehydrogenase [FAD, quinone]-like n=1 Tax=Zerene cesonia TaxID=33412 RepID=UPI0018E5320C|nr:glucose dehydrogenase [FAD, quinone]-like [Zerene cesonia]
MQYHHVVALSAVSLILFSTGAGGDIIDALTGFVHDVSDSFSSEPPDTKFLNAEYDFIIIGAGTAGCVLANRLTEVKKFKVLLIEAGGPELSFMDIPLLATLLQLTEANWNYRTEPQEAGCKGMEDGRCHWPRGKVVGGSSVLHSMIYTRGNRKDYDGWAAAGNPGWEYDSVMKYFKKLENMQIPHLAKNTKYHSTKGPMTIQYPRYRTPIADAFVQAGTETGGKTVDYNGETQIGYSMIQFTLKNGSRVSASKGYLHPIKKRKNFHLVKFAMVTKILIDKWTKKALGVEFERAGAKHIIKARREVILSAGAINSPQLLMISGIGPKEHLMEKNITTIRNLPVGYNLQDHWASGGITFVINTTDSIRGERALNPESVLEYYTTHSGPLSAPTGTEALAFIDTKDPDNKDDGQPDLELLFTAGSTVSSVYYQKAFMIDSKLNDIVYKPIADRDTWMVLPMILLPKSRGRIMLQDKDPYVKPLIYANYFSDGGHDANVVLKGIRKIIQLSRTKALQRFNSTLHDIPLPPCAHHKFDSDAYWLCAMKTLTLTIYHHCCTNKMGPETDPSAVVDSRLRVHGIDKLRVVDASVMPNIPAAHTNAPTLMLAEKAADMIKEDWGIPV